MKGIEKRRRSRLALPHSHSPSLLIGKPAWVPAVGCVTYCRERERGVVCDSCATAGGSCSSRRRSGCNGVDAGHVCRAQLRLTPASPPAAPITAPLRTTVMTHDSRSRTTALSGEVSYQHQRPKSFNGSWQQKLEIGAASLRRAALPLPPVPTLSNKFHSPRVPTLGAHRSSINYNSSSCSYCYWSWWTYYWIRAGVRIFVWISCSWVAGACHSQGECYVSPFVQTSLLCNIIQQSITSLHC